jgi:hypothetical protein
MSQEPSARQFSFRLPQRLVTEVEECMGTLQTAGLDVTRADVVRLLLKHALETTKCNLTLLLGKKNLPRRSRSR